ncbi:hypothetical protein TNCV_1267081 [Trichonephila clavipes]|nr:hypothetical protein TNCV_1267081 [Trichonephila clavipes]
MMMRLSFVPFCYSVVLLLYLTVNHYAYSSFDAFKNDVVILPSEEFLKEQPGLCERHRTGGEKNILQLPAPVVSVATTRKTFRPADLTNTYSVCTRKVFGGIGHRTQALRSGV